MNQNQGISKGSVCYLSIIFHCFYCPNRRIAMRQSRSLFLLLSSALLIAVLLTVYSPANSFAQVPAADTPTSQPTEPATSTPTATLEPTATTVPTDTAEPTATEAPGTAVPTATTQPTATAAPPAPVSIPEPITVVLFGTGLAALSAAAARRKKESGKGDE
jgi:cytoskeletal protein RodZ